LSRHLVVFSTNPFPVAKLGNCCRLCLDRNEKEYGDVVGTLHVCMFSRYLKIQGVNKLRSSHLFLTFYLMLMIQCWHYYVLLSFLRCLYTEIFIIGITAVCYHYYDLCQHMSSLIFLSPEVIKTIFMWKLFSFFVVLSLFNNKCLYFLSRLLIVYIAAQSNKNWPTFFVVAFLPLFFNNHAMMLQLFAWVSALRPKTCMVWTNVALRQRQKILEDFLHDSCMGNFTSSLLQDFSPLYV